MTQDSKKSNVQETSPWARVMINSALSRLSISQQAISAIRIRISDLQEQLHKEERTVAICQDEIRFMNSVMQPTHTPSLVEQMRRQEDEVVLDLLHKAAEPPNKTPPEKQEEPAPTKADVVAPDNPEHMKDWQAKAMQHLASAKNTALKSEDIYSLLIAENGYKVKSRKTVAKFLRSQLYQGRTRRVRRGWYMYVRTGKWTEVATAWISIRGQRRFSWQELSASMEAAGFPGLTPSAVTSFMHRCVEGGVVETVRKGVYRKI